jgi:hypothetical protein
MCPKNIGQPLKILEKNMKDSAIDSFSQAEYDSETIETFPQVV